MSLRALTENRETNVNEPGGERSRIAGSEIARLGEYAAGFNRAWEHDAPHIEELLKDGGRPYELLVQLVQEYFLRAISYANGIVLVLEERLGIAFFPLLRSLYEVHLALLFLARKSEGEQLREAQVASIHRLFHLRARIHMRIREKRELATDGRERKEIEEQITALATEFPADILAEAEGRQTCYSWMGDDVYTLLDSFGLADDYYKTYSRLSAVTHGHHTLIAVNIVDWTPDVYERHAATSRSHLVKIRRLLQDILHLPFSDASIDSIASGDFLEVRYSHAWLKVMRP